MLLAQQEAADAPEAAETPEFQGLPFPLLMAIILLTGYFLVFRPQQQKQREARNQLENLKEKDRIVTIGGIHGRVTNLRRDSDEVTILVDESTGTKMRINKSAISRVLTDENAGKQGSSGKRD